MTETPSPTAQLELSEGEEDSEEVIQWRPRLSPRQHAIFDSKAKILLINGPRFSGKSIVISHMLMRNAWERYNCNIAVIVSSYKVAMDSGNWIDLLDAAKEWSQSGIVSQSGSTFEITSIDPKGEPGSKTDAKNRTPFFKLRNQFGGESKIHLFSIDNENEIDKKLKGTRFQIIWIAELSNFKKRGIVSGAYFQLRGLFDEETGVRTSDDDVQLLIDTNPAEEGKKSWIYSWFYERDGGKVKDPKLQAIVDKCTARMVVEELSLDDNTFLSEDKKEELMWLLAGDPHNYERLVEGKWPDGPNEKSALFADVFSDDLIVEDCIDVSDLTEVLYSGFDLGPKNKAWTLAEKRFEKGQIVWCILDELVYIGDYVSTDDFTAEVLDKMIAINKHYQEKRVNFKGFKFVHWSDASSFVPKMEDEGATEAVEIYNASNEQIEIRPCEKPAKSVESGCQMIRKLMRERRLFVGKNCPNLIESFQRLRRPSKGTFTIDPSDRLKHSLDSWRYICYAESIDDLMNDPMKHKHRDSRTIRIPL